MEYIKRHSKVAFHSPSQGPKCYGAFCVTEILAMTSLFLYLDQGWIFFVIYAIRFFLISKTSILTSPATPGGLVYLVMLRITLTRKCILDRSHGKKGVFVRVYPELSLFYHREATFFEKPSRCSLVIMLAQCASAYTRLLFLEADIHTTRHPPGTDSPINSRCLLHLLSIE